MQGVIDYLKPERVPVRERTLRVCAVPERIRPAAASQRYAGVRRLGGEALPANRPGGAALLDARAPHRGGEDAAREGQRPAPSALRGLRALRRAAARTAGPVEVAALRAAHRRRRALRRAARATTRARTWRTSRRWRLTSRPGPSCRVILPSSSKARRRWAARSLASFLRAAPGGTGLRCDRHLRHGHADAEASGVDLCAAGNCRRLRSRCTARRAICTPAFSAGRWTTRRWRCANCWGNCATRMAA